MKYATEYDPWFLDRMKSDIDRQAQKAADLRVEAAKWDQNVIPEEEAERGQTLWTRLETPIV